MQRYTIKNISASATALLLLIMSACTQRRKTPDVSNISMPVKVVRFDQELYRVDTANVQAGLHQLYQQYPYFLPTYLQDILNFGPYQDSVAPVPAAADAPRMTQADAVRKLLTNKDLLQLKTVVDGQFANMDSIGDQLSLAFKYTKYYFPHFRAPRVIAFTSAVSNYGAITADSVLGLGLDMYLGSKFDYHLIPDLPDYMIRRFDKPYLVPDAIKALEQQMFPPKTTGTQLLTQMVDAGRQQYFLDMVLPGVADTLRTGYTADQLKWCEDNEQMIWQYFVQQKLLYITDWQEVTHYMGEGPSTQGMPEGSPGKIGLFVGWQIVKSYMDRHPDVTLQQLMVIKDPLQIYNEAKYKPK